MNNSGLELDPVFIKATTIPDAWFQAIWALLDHGFDYEIQDGSYVGDKRLEFDHFTALITHPQARPLEPDIPKHYGIPNPVAEGYIDQYLRYIMTDARDPGEQYTYGSRINAGDVSLEVWGYLMAAMLSSKAALTCDPKAVTAVTDCTVTAQDGSIHTKDYPAIDSPVKVIVSQVEHFIRRMKKAPAGNQYILQIAQPSDCLIPDSPCLRHIDMRIKDGRLIFYPYFRSWDLWGGFPANLGGIVHLQEYMAGQIGVEPGPFIVASKGLHLYKYVWELAKMRTGQKIKVEE